MWNKVLIVALALSFVSAVLAGAAIAIYPADSLPMQAAILSVGSAALVGLLMAEAKGMFALGGVAIYLAIISFAAIWGLIKFLEF